MLVLLPLVFARAVVVSSADNCAPIKHITRAVASGAEVFGLVQVKRKDSDWIGRGRWQLTHRESYSIVYSVTKSDAGSPSPEGVE